MRRKIGYKVQSKNKTTSNNDNPLFQLQNNTLKQLWTMKVERDQQQQPDQKLKDWRQFHS